MRRRSQSTNTTVDFTETSRFDLWATEDVYTALESQIMDLQRTLDDYHRSPEPDSKAKVLGVMDIKMQTASEALGVLRRRLAVANDKRNQ